MRINALVHSLSKGLPEVNGWTLLVNEHTDYERQGLIPFATKFGRVISIEKFQDDPSLFGCKIHGVKTEHLRLVHPVGVREGAVHYRVTLPLRQIRNVYDIRQAVEMAFRRMWEDNSDE